MKSYDNAKDTYILDQINGPTMVTLASGELSNFITIQVKIVDKGLNGDAVSLKVNIHDQISKI